MQEMQVQSLDWEDSPGEGNGNPLSVLAWRNPWTEEPGGLQSMGLQRVRHGWSNWEEQSKIKKNYSPATPKFYILYFGEIWEHRPVRKVKKKETMGQWREPSRDQSPTRASECTDVLQAPESCFKPACARASKGVRCKNTTPASSPCFHLTDDWAHSCPQSVLWGAWEGLLFLCSSCRTAFPTRPEMSPSIIHSLSSSTALFLVFCSLAVPNLNGGMQTLSCSTWDWVPWPGMEPGPAAFGVQSLSPWTIREVSPSSFYSNYKCATLTPWYFSMHKSTKWNQEARQAGEDGDQVGGGDGISTAQNLFLHQRFSGSNPILLTCTSLPLQGKFWACGYVFMNY